MNFEVEGIDHVAICVRDVAHSAKWYGEVLGFERRYAETWGDVPTFVVKGTTGIALFPANDHATRASKHRDHIGMTHLAFRATREQFEAAQRDLTSRGIRFEFSDHEIAHSIYFHDPDGIRLEITTYEMTR